MKDLNAICLECENDLAAIGIKLGRITEYTVNSRAKTRLGLCSANREEWKRLARKVSAAYGIDITRVASPDEIAVKIHATQRREQAKYKYECQNCGRVHINMRASGFTRHPELYRCGRCGTMGNWKRIN